MERKYRLNAGVVLFNQAGKVLVFHRFGYKKADEWQFPQGGIEDDETPIEAARRELGEETGISSVEWVTTLDKPLRYNFPQKTLKEFRKIGRNFIGQEQYWSLFFFTGEDSEIDLNTHPQEIEFDKWQWLDIAEAMEKVWVVKKDVYRKVVQEFAPIIAEWLKNKKGTN